MVSAIACVDKNWGIGFQGKLLVNIPEDMRFFREKTANSVVIMGRKTYDSLSVKPLPNRINIVITSKVDKTTIDEKGVIFITMDFAKTYLNTLPSNSPVDYYVIGGGQIYKELLPYCNKAYITMANYAFENADAFFPNLENDKDWEMTENGAEKIHHGIHYNFCTYKKEEKNL